jgi:hypothetical protein
MKIKQLIVEKDLLDDQHIYTILTNEDRIFVGGINDGRFQWLELPPPSPVNTKWVGDSPFTERSKLRGPVR